jgi:hypothetical protein
VLFVYLAKIPRTINCNLRQTYRTPVHLRHVLVRNYVKSEADPAKPCRDQGATDCQATTSEEAGRKRSTNAENFYYVKQMQNKRRWLRLQDGETSMARLSGMTKTRSN